MFNLGRFGWTRGSIGGGVIVTLLRNAKQWITGANDGVQTLADQSTNVLDIDLKQSGALVFDNGETDVILTDYRLPLTGDFDASWNFITASDVTSNQHFIGQYIGGNSGRLQLLITGGNIRLVFGGTVGWDVAVSASTEYTIRFYRESGVFKIDLNGSNVGSYSNATAIADIDLVIGSYQDAGGQQLGGTMWNFRVDSDIILPMNETAGSIVYDTSGNGNHCTISTTSGLATMRSARQDTTHANMLNGFSAGLSYNGTDAYSDTGYTATLNTRIEVVGRFLDTTVNDYMGSYSAGSGTFYEFGMRAGGTWYFSWRNQTTLNAGVADTELHTFVIDGGKFYVDDLVNELVDFSAGTGTLPPHSLYIAERNDGVGVPIVPCEFELRSYKIYESGVLVREFIPANSSGSVLAEANGNNGTSTNVEYGLKFPALEAGSNDVTGETIANPPIADGVVHNGAETLLEQQAGQEASLGHSGLYYEADGTTEKQVSFADLKAWVSGTDETFLGMAQNANGTCVATASLIYATDFYYSPSELALLQSKYPNTCGAGEVVQLYDVNGVALTDVNGKALTAQP